MRALLVYNPTAGTMSHDKGSIIDALQLADMKVDYVSAKDGDLRRALRNAADVVIAAGGDGTIDYIFTHLEDRSIPIGILPLGSANNVARSLGIAGTAAELAEEWRFGHMRSFHLAEITHGKGKRALCTEGFGIGPMASLLKRCTRGKKANGADGILRGRRALSALLNSAEPIDLEINIDGERWQSGLIGIDVLNIPFTGPALPLAYNADPGGALLEVVGFESDKRDELIEWIKNPHRGPPPASVRRGKQVEIRWRAADSRFGDKMAKGHSGWRQALVRCDPAPLHVLVPTKRSVVASSVNDEE